MGILNVTPDSFSDAGAYSTLSSVIDRVSEMCEQGADIIDIGGESSRPGADEISVSEELDRVLPVIEAIRSRFDCLVSLDTRKSVVAAEGLPRGVDIINDISGLTHDENMCQVIASYQASVVVMHMQGHPKSMQVNPHYSDVVLEVSSFFDTSIQMAKAAGISSIILDPGIGFGKQLNHNLALLAQCNVFLKWGYPILIGTSRKSFISAIDSCDVSHRLGGSIASQLWALNKGAHIFRVHDVEEAVQSIAVWKAIKEHDND